MKKIKKLSTIILMGVGIFTGTMILILTSTNQQDQSVGALIEEHHPEKSITSGVHQLKGLIRAFQSQSSLEQMMQKDALTTEDSLEIEQIDQQINQLFHD